MRPPIVFLRRRDRVRNDISHVDRLVDYPIDERSIRTVFQQSPDQVWQQVLVAPHRCVHAARPRELLGIDDLCVEFFAHTVKALKLVIEARAGVMHHAGKGMRIVRRKLGVKRFAGVQRFPRTGQVGHVRVHLARKYRVTLQSEFLRVLYFRIPVRTFDEAYRYSATCIPGQPFQVAEYVARPTLVGLHRQPEAVVPRQPCIAEYLLEDLQG